MAANTREEAAHAETALNQLRGLPARAVDTRAKGKACRTLACLQDVVLQDKSFPNIPCHPPPSHRQPSIHPRFPCKVACIHGCLVMGSLSQAAQWPEAQRSLESSDEVYSTFQALHR
jgi:hypothetical protein